MKTLYIHVGQPKTGTTALQLFCLHNPEALHAKGYDYPSLPFSYEHIADRRNGHFLVGVLRDKDGNRLLEEEERRLNIGLETIKKSFEQYDNVVLSDERLWHASKGKLFSYWNTLSEHAANHGYTIKMIVYLRRQDVFAMSWRNQMIKNGWEGKYGQLRWSEWIKDTPGIELDYYKLLEKIAKVIGKDNILVRIYDRTWLERDGGNIYTDFLDAIGLQMDDSFTIEEEDPNPSLTLNLQEIKRIINNTPGYVGGGKKDILGKAVRLCAAGNNPDYPCSMFSVRELKKFLAAQKSGNDKIAQEYLHRRGPLFDPTIKELDKWTENNPFMYEDIVRYFSQLALLQQGEIEKLKETVSNQQKMLSSLLKNQN